MDLTPIDLKKQEFKRVVRGYDPIEVRRFLEEVADAWETLIRAREALQGRVDELGGTIENYRRMERTLNETLLMAQRVAEESRETSVREAELLRKEAELEGRRSIERAEAEARAVRDQVREMRVQRDGLFLKLRSLMEEELLRLEALRDAFADLPGPRADVFLENGLANVPPAGAESSGPASREPAERRTVTPPPAGAREFLEHALGFSSGSFPVPGGEQVVRTPVPGSPGR